MKTGGDPATMTEMTVDKLAISQVRKFEAAIIKDAVIKNNVLKFRSVESAIREDHMPVTALEDT